MNLKTKILSKREKSKDKQTSFAANIAKGSLIALSFSLIGILVFAFILKFTSISEKVITPVNEVIKGVSIFLGVFLALKKQRERGLISGLIIGILYSIIAFIVFSLLAGTFSLEIKLLFDILFGGIIGGICGIICVNIKKSSTN